jgi:hypothetical protein
VFSGASPPPPRWANAIGPGSTRKRVHVSQRIPLQAPLRLPAPMLRLSVFRQPTPRVTRVRGPWPSPSLSIAFVTTSSHDSSSCSPRPTSCVTRSPRWTPANAQRPKRTRRGRSRPRSGLRKRPTLRNRLRRGPQHGPPTRRTAQERRRERPPGQAKTKVLAALSSAQALTAGEVATATGLARPTVSTTLSKLSKTGGRVKAEPIASPAPTAGPQALANPRAGERPPTHILTAPTPH